MRKIAIVNQKGGCGKSTTTVNLGAALGLLGKKVLLIDLDGQRNTTRWCDVAELERDDLIERLMEHANPLELVVPTKMQNVDVIPASRGLYDCESRMSGPMVELRLRMSMKTWSQPWDYVLMDCPADFKTLTSSAILAATDVLIVTKPGGMDIDGMQELFLQLGFARESLKMLNADINVLGVLLCQVDPRTRAAKDCTQYISEAYPGLLFDTVIRHSTRFLECPSWHQPITEYATGSAGDKDYRALAGEVIERTGGDIQ